MPTSESGLLVLGGDDVGSLLSGPQLLEALARALQAYSAGEADSPPRIAALAPKGLLAAMPAYLPGQGLAAKLIAVFPGNPTQGRPSHQGLVALFDDRDGRPLCVLDAKQITAVRTAAVSALSVRELARPGAAVLAVLGSGEQARFGENLEAVADAEHQSAAGGKPLNRLHYGGESGNCPGSEVIAIGESAGHEHRIDAAQIF